MPVKIKAAYNANSNAGDSINDEDYLAFEQDLSGSASNSWGTKFSQLVSYLSGKFYLQGTTDDLLAGKIPQVSGQDTHAVVQDGNGNLITTGKPLGTIEKFTTPLINNWAQDNHTLTSHTLSRAPDIVHVSGVFQNTSATLAAGWTGGEEVSVAIGAIGGADLSSLAIYIDADNFQIYNSCTSADTLLVPHKTNGSAASVALSQADIFLEITFIAVY